MIRRVLWIAVGLAVVAALLLTTVFAQVDFNEVAMIKRFGMVRQVVDGRQQPGLAMKWPWPIESVEFYKTGLFTFQDPVSQIQLRNKQNVYLSMFCQWRIADPVKFHQTVLAVDRAEGKISPLLQTFKADVVGTMEMNDLVNVDPQKVKLAWMEQQVFDRLGAKLLADYGIELAQVGVKSIGLPENVSQEVIKAQISEREEDAKTLEAQGRAEAQAIRERAKAAQRVIIAFAEQKAALIEAEGDIAAARELAKFREAPELSVFLRYVETLKALKDRSMFLLDESSIPAVRWFLEGPKTVQMPASLKAMPAASGGKAQPAQGGN